LSITNDLTLGIDERDKRFINLVKLATPAIFSTDEPTQSVALENAIRSLASPSPTAISSGLTTTTNTTQALVQALPSSDSTQAEPPPSVLRLLPLPLTSLVDEKTEIKSLAIAKAAVDLPILLLSNSQEGMKTSDIFREFPNVDSVVVRSLLKSVASVDSHTKHWSVVSRQAILNQTQDEVLVEYVGLFGS